MRNNLRISVLVCTVLSLVPFSLANAALAAADQTQGEERVIHHPKVEVEKAIQDLHATLKGRLPILDGFAEQSGEQWDRFTRGYFECAVQVVANGQDETRVRITAKITAWYTDPNPAQSGYRVLVSNGRVETDLLDRLEETFAANDPASVTPQSSHSIASRPESFHNSGLISPLARLRSGTSNLAAADTSTPVRGEMNTVSPKPAASIGASAIAGPSSSQDIQSIRHQREEAEKKISELNTVVHNLDEILQNQTHPTDIAVVRKAGTHVMPKPSVVGPTLLLADSEDEFQVLDSGPDWVHVQISGVSRGWIRRSDLILPAGMKETLNRVDAATPANAQSFRVVREETNTFKGKWEPLNGKMVKIIWAGSELVGAPASSLAMRNFAKSLLVKAYQDIAHNSEVAGVVIVFDSADGGQISATIQGMTQWQSGRISEASFWPLCLVEPADLFDR